MLEILEKDLLSSHKTWEDNYLITQHHCSPRDAGKLEMYTNLEIGPISCKIVRKFVIAKLV